AIRILFDLHNIGEGRVTRWRAQQQQIAESDHCGQQIVKIMGDTASKLSDGLHFLGLCELDLKVLLFGDVDEMEGEPSARAGTCARTRRESAVRRIVEAA